MGNSVARDGQMGITRYFTFKNNGIKTTLSFRIKNDYAYLLLGIYIQFNNIILNPTFLISINRDVYITNICIDYAVHMARPWCLLLKYVF